MLYFVEKGVIKMFIFILLAIIILYIWVFTSAEDTIANEKEKYRKEGLEYVGISSFECLGGFKDMGACKDCFIDLFEDRLRIKLYKKNQGGGILGSKEVEIMMKDIIDISLENERTISERISLGNLVVFGFLALGMKQVEINRELLVLSFKYENDIVNLVLDKTKYGNELFSFVQQVNSLRNSQQAI